MRELADTLHLLATIASTLGKSYFIIAETFSSIREVATELTGLDDWLEVARKAVVGQKHGDHRTETLLGHVADACRHILVQVFYLKGRLLHGGECKEAQAEGDRVSVLHEVHFFTCALRSPRASLELHAAVLDYARCENIRSWYVPKDLDTARY